MLSLIAPASVYVSAAPATTPTTGGQTTADINNKNTAAIAKAKTDGAATTAPKTTNDPAQPANPDTGKYSDQYVKDYYSNTGVPPGTPILAMPQKFWRSAGRYGEFRDRTSVNDFHAGLDLSPLNNQLNLRSAGPGKVTDVGVNGGGGNIIGVKRDNGDKYMYLHMENNLKNKFPIGSEIKSNQPLGVMGGSSNRFRADGSEIKYATHLHFDYILPNNDKARLRDTWLAQSPRSSGLLNSTRHVFKTGYGYNTDPTPYLAEDVVVKGDVYSPWLGTTIRQQFNALYNTKMPLGPGAQSSLRPIPALPVFNQGFEWTPENLAAARGAIVKGAEFADWSGYTGAFGASGGGSMSYQTIASFISSDDGEQFGSLPQPEKPVNIETMTPKEIVEYIGGARFGNEGWEKAMLKLSSKGMLTEYLMMNATENYLHQQNQVLRNRVEMLMAGITQARLFEFNKQIEAIQVAAQASSVPGILDLELVDLGYSYGGGGGQGPAVDIGNLPDELEALVRSLMDAISHGEGGYNAYNTGTNGPCAMKGFSTDEAARATGTPMITTMTPRQIWKAATATYSSCDVTRKFTAGRYQLTYYTLAGKNTFGNNGFVAAYPQYKDVPFTPEVQDFAARNYFLLGGNVRKNLTALIKGDPKATVESAMYDLAQEWASFGTPHGKRLHQTTTTAVGNYQSFYGGDGINKGNKQSTDMAWAVLKKIHAWNQANPGEARAVLSGKAQDKGMGSAQAPATTPPATTTPPGTTPPVTPPGTTPPAPKK